MVDVTIQGGPEKKPPKTKILETRAHKKTPQMLGGFFLGLLPKWVGRNLGVSHFSPKKNPHDNKISQYSVYTAVSLVELFAWFFFLG